MITGSKKNVSTIDYGEKLSLNTVNNVNNSTRSSNSHLSAASDWMRREGSEMCSRSFFHRRFPVSFWLPKYTLDDLLHDFIAGLTVGLTTIPQGIAYAVVAGLEPQFGLYSAFMGCFAYFVLGTSKDITIGPTAILALMTQPYVSSLGPDFAIMLCFVTGCVILLSGLLHLGFLVDFISMPVTAGFTSAAAVTIASSQVKGLLGLKGSGNNFMEAWANTFEHIGETRLWDTVMGVATIVILLLAKKMSTFDKGRNVNEMGFLRKMFSKTVWLFSLGRNAVVVIAGTLIAYILFHNGLEPFSLTGTVREGLPPFKPPPFSTFFHNQTYTFTEMFSELGASVITVPIIAILECIAVAKAFANGKLLDATQEMIALGMCNIMGSFVSSMPVTGSFTRTAVNHASGVRTPLGGLFTGSLIILALGVLTSAFYFIPKAVLAGLIICAMFFMVEYHAVILLWKTKKLDLIPLFTTFLCCLFLSLEIGILIGIGVNILFILYVSARPTVDIRDLTIATRHILLVKPESSLVYPSAEHFRDLVIRSSIYDTNAITHVIVDGSLVKNVDATVAKNLKSLTEDLTLQKQTVIFWNWRKDAMTTCLGLDPNLSNFFRFGDTIEELLKEDSGAESDAIDIFVNSMNSD